MGILNDHPGDLIAISTRLCDDDYAGDCMTVRRTSDNAEDDIPFTNRVLDEDAVAAHCGASAGKVVEWFDQSGNGFNPSKSIASQQPEIYDGSSVHKMDADFDIAAPFFDVTFDNRLAVSMTRSFTDYTLYANCSQDDNSEFGPVAGFGNTDYYYFAYALTSDGAMATTDGTNAVNGAAGTFPNGEQSAITVLGDAGANEVTIRRNGTEVVSAGTYTDTGGGQNFGIGSAGDIASNKFDGHIAEIFFRESLSSDSQRDDYESHMQNPLPTLGGSVIRNRYSLDFDCRNRWGIR